jgi:hypothetical protein
MAIAAKPKRQQADADAFIAGAGKSDISPATEDDDEKVVTTLRVSRKVLRQIDAAAKKRGGISRTAYILFAVAKAMEDNV